MRARGSVEPLAYLNERAGSFRLPSGARGMHITEAGKTLRSGLTNGAGLMNQHSAKKWPTGKVSARHRASVALRSGFPC